MLGVGCWVLDAVGVGCEHLFGGRARKDLAGWALSATLNDYIGTVHNFYIQSYT